MGRDERNEQLAFLNLSGIIDEFGRVQLLPTLNSPDRPTVRMPSERSSWRARYRYGHDQVIERMVATSEIQACGPAKRTGLDYLAFHVSLPRMERGQSVQLLRDDDVVFERKIDDPPRLSKVVAEVRDGQLQARWEVESSSLVGCFTFLRFDDRRSLPVGVTSEKNEVSLDLVGLPEGGVAVVEVVASDGLLNGSGRSQKVKIPPSPPLGMITSPIHGSVSPPGQPHSLIGNAHGAFSQKIDWDEQGLLWRVDGEVVGKGAAQVVLRPLEPGTHTIELGSERWGVLDSAKITVARPTAQHERLEELLASVGGGS